MKFRTAYDGERCRQTIDFFDEHGEQAQGRTHQEFKDECDVNLIIPKYDRTGLLTHVNEAVAQYGDYSEVNEYQESMNLVLQAQQSFGEIPANIRAMFNNDPGIFFEFATDPKNREKMVELGLAEAPQKTEKKSTASRSTQNTPKSAESGADSG